MPANRSRTMRWRESLRQIKERKGALEIAVARSYEEVEGGGSHLIWRVRLLDLSEDEIVVEQPIALGQRIKFTPGVEIVAILSVGQNRWMFHTEHIAATEVAVSARHALPGLRLKMPDSVQRCQRRNHHRMPTASLNLPQIDLWPLLDPKTVVVAERANELEAQRDQSKPASEGSAALEESPATGVIEAEHIMPEVGPRFEGLLLNIGGGGVGLQVAPEHGNVISRHRLFWMRMILRPELHTPICASAKLVHSQLRSDQQVYAGLAFDFTFNPTHERFVADQICQFIADQQRGQAGA